VPPYYFGTAFKYKLNNIAGYGLRANTWLGATGGDIPLARL
jgi:hypothetical protein